MFCPNEPLRHGCHRHQKSASDLIGLEAAEGSKSQRDLRLERQRRVAAGKDQTKAIVGDRGRVVVRLFNSLAELGGGVRFDTFPVPGYAAHAVDGLVPGHPYDPCAREFWNSRAAPVIYGGRKCFLHDLFGHFEIARETDQGGDDAAPVDTVDRLDSPIGIPIHGTMVKNILAGCRFLRAAFDITCRGTHDDKNRSSAPQG
jgi:hypothetical protein